MKKIDVTTQWVAPYFEGKKKCKSYSRAVDAYHHVSFHFDGYFAPPLIQDLGQGVVVPSDMSNSMYINPYFTRLIDMRRPSESLEIKAYRRNIYLPQTKSPCFKVYNSLRKIVKAEDWKIDYSKVEKNSKVADDENLEDYCESDYPFFDSIENWIYTYAFKQMLVDANALCYVIPLPKNDALDETEYYRPFSQIAPTLKVIDFKDNELAVFECDHKTMFIEGGIECEGKIITIITRAGVWEARQTKSDNSFSLTQTNDFIKDFGKEMEYLPAWKLGGIDKEFTIEGRLYDSFLFPIIPGLDAAAREMSDADAEVVQHVYSTMWYYSLQNCKTCSGSGKVLKGGKQTICKDCTNGVASKTPYTDMVLNPSTFDGEKMPTPPAGYITKQTDMVKLQAERIASHVYNALSAINMEWLSSMSQTQSGVAKEVDRDELNNYVYGIAYHLVETLVKPIYYFVNEFRYCKVIVDGEAREKQLPTIAIPSKFDILTSNILEQQMKSAMDSKADSEIIDQLELEYVQKKFPNEPDLRNRMKLKKSLDPFPRLTIDEKNNLALNKLADPLDLIVSNYLQPFIEMALFEDENFMTLDFDKQKEAIYKMGEEKLSKMDASQKIKDKAIAQKGLDPKTNQPFAQ
jgi:hypothetical protein